MAGCKSSLPPLPPAPKDLPKVFEEATPTQAAASGEPNAADVADIYVSFLKEWTDGGRQPVRVAREAKAPPPEELREFSHCAFGAEAVGSRWQPVRPVKDLRNSIGSLSHVQLVDAVAWKPLDPGDLIAQGHPVESAVRAGFGHGLLTLSAIAFDTSRNTAAFSYSFVCGKLCGNGGTVLLERTPKGWTKSARECGRWIS
jgi:hypothetical protein